MSTDQRPPFRWIIDLGRFMGKRVGIETIDGTHDTRVSAPRGRIFTRLVRTDLLIQGVRVEMPSAVILDGEETIPIPFSNIAKLWLVEP